MYRIKDWYQLFENNCTREVKRMDWVPVPNRMDGAGYTALVDHPNGAAHLGAWLAMIEISSRQKVRGLFPQESAELSQVLARMSRLPAGLFEEVLPRLLQIGWIERDSEIPQESAELTRARFPSVPFHSVLKEGMGGNRELAPESTFPDWWQMWSRVRGTHHSVEALEAWLKHVPADLESAAIECTTSYLASLENPAKGYNPHTFLEAQAKERFGSRWPEFIRNGVAKESRAARRAREMDEEAIA